MGVRSAPQEMMIVLLMCLGVSAVAGRPCDFYTSLNFLNCSSRGLFFVPAENPHFNDSQGIDLSHNSIEKITGGEFSKSSGLKYLDLSYNNITDLGSKAFRGLDNLVTLNFSGNYVHLSSDVITPELFEPLVSLEEIRIQEIVPMTTSKWKGVDAAFGKLENLRRFIAYNNFGNCRGPMLKGLDNLTEIDLSGIRCSRMSRDFFLHLRKLKKLSLSNSHGLDFSSSSLTYFDLLDTLESIDLSGNKITELHPRLFQDNRNLMKINLANNKLNRLPKALFQIAQLKKLDLSANAFTYLQSDEMALIDGWITRARIQDPFSLILARNPIQCTCDTVLFIRWIVLRKINLDHPDNYTCLLSNGSQLAIYKFRRDMRNFEVNCVSSTYIIISVVAISTSLILILSLAGMYRYRLNLRYWLYTRLKPPKDMFSGVEYVFNAFVAYTHEDREWVKQQLRPKLELHEDPFKLCIHDRDFLPGRPIHENIVDNIRQSRKVLLIISTHFLDSTYGPLEIEYAGMKCLDEGRDDIIVCVLMEEIPVRQMPRALRNLWHKITFLKWNFDPEHQAIFWGRLSDALR
ncbi:toll-like receptor 13 [Liolophura sinensis]|uniref:toll-like receptor 13 n=1 Tax=Liolophura sinensis TaxID=3198878 RepID=UPI003158A3F7